MSPADLFKTFPGFPILLSLLLLAPLAARGLAPGLARAVRLAVLWTIGATALLALLLAFANLLVPDYVDNVEPAVVGNAWIWWHGGTLYPPLDAQASLPELRGLLYGPLTFLLAGIAPVLLGPSILVSKLPPVGLFLVTVALTWLACRRVAAPAAGGRRALLATACMVTVLGISEAPYWVRGDTVLMLIGALSVWLVARPAGAAPWRRAILLGLLAGSASAVKLHGAAYVAPACLVLLFDVLLAASGGLRAVPWGRGLLVLVLLGGGALVAVAWPFLLRGIPFDGYAFHLRLATRHGFSRLLLAGNLTLLFGVCLPLLVLALDRQGAAMPRIAPRMQVLAGGGFACAALVALVASKPGAGYPHLLPFLPYAAVLLARLLPVLSPRVLSPPVPSRPAAAFRLAALGVLFCAAFGVPVLVRAATFASRGAAFAVIGAAERQARAVLAAHPDAVVAVGYGGGSFLDLRLSYLRVLPVFAGRPLLYDATAMDDLWQGGIDRAIALRAIDTCGVGVWLIPGDAPFTIRNFYGGFTFSEAFRADFAAHYRQEVADGPFHVWVCREAGKN